jgi:hypothetical protein
MNRSLPPSIAPRRFQIGPSLRASWIAAWSTRSRCLDVARLRRRSDRYNRARVANVSLGRADRAIALKFLVHLVGDLHQPFHALSVARGGNDLPVVAFGSSSCIYSDGTSYPCNLHGAGDTSLIALRGLTARQYLDELSRQIDQCGWGALATRSARMGDGIARARDEGAPSCTRRR